MAVPGATLRLVEVATGRAWVSWTDENGKFDLPGLPPGRYRLEATQLGFALATKEVELTAEAAPPIELTLSIAPLAAEAPVSTPSRATESEAAKTAPKAALNGATNSATPSTAVKPGTGQPPVASRQGRQAPTGAAETMRRRTGQNGFQQVDPTGQQQLDTVPESASTMEEGPLGQASSSDAFLISGTVGRGANPGEEGAGGPFGVFGGFGPGAPGMAGGPGMEGGGFPAQAGGPGGPGGPGGAMIYRRQIPGGQEGGGRGQPQRGRGGQAAGRQGIEGLWGLQRVLRERVNRVHASFYDSYGNSALDARSYSLTGVTTDQIPSWRERLGGNLGGPLRIPHVYDGRDRTFFFVNGELGWARNPVDMFSSVPTVAERAGDFTDRSVQLFDPTSNLAGPRAPLGGVIPQNMLNQAALGLLQFIPLPNLPGLVQNFHLQTRVPTANARLNLRVMHTISPKLNAQATYNLSNAHTHAFQSFPDLESNQETRGQNLMLGLTQNWTQRLIHDSRVFWNRNRVQTLNQFAFTNDIGAALGITGISTAPVDFGVPQISLTNFTGLNDPVPSLVRNQTLRYVDNLSYMLAKHTLRAGGEVRRIQVNTRSDPIPRGSFTFTGLMTSQLDSSGQPVSGSGFDFADFLLGLPQATTERFGTPSTYFRSWGFVGYFQDDWRIHPRFSLEWGVRYEAFTPPVELFDHIANLDVNSDFAAVATVLPGQVGPFSGPLPHSLVRGDYNNWAPRIGLAWKPPLKWLSGKHSMTVRAGYGMFYNESIYNQLAASMANQPPFAEAQTRLTSVAQLLTLQDGFPPAPPNVARNTVSVDPNYRVGYAQIWNLSTETQLATNTILDVTYTGTQGTHLDLLRAPNRAPLGSPLNTDPNRRISNALGFTYDTFGASSTYNALQVRLQKRMSHGLMLYGIYTFGKSLDNASTIGGGAQVVAQDDNNFSLERGLSSFDTRQQFRSFYYYELPFGDRKRWASKGWKAGAFGNWTFSGNLTLRSGTPFTARVLGTAADNTGTGANFSGRADQVGDPSLPASQRTPMQFFNTAAFVVPPPGRFGDAARNTIPGPGMFVWNVAVARRIPFGKDQQRRLDLRWEVSNLTNTPNFTGLSTVVNSATYGRVLGAQGMRTMNIVVRVNF